MVICVVTCRCLGGLIESSSWKIDNYILSRRSLLSLQLRAILTHPSLNNNTHPQDHLFFFYLEEVKAKFMENPDKYIMDGSLRWKTWFPGSFFIRLTKKLRKMPLFIIIIHDHLSNFFIHVIHAHALCNL